MNTEVTVTVIQRDSQLLFQRRKKEPYKGHLGLLGGKRERGEYRDQALRREVKGEALWKLLVLIF